MVHSSCISPGFLNWAVDSNVVTAWRRVTKITSKWRRDFQVTPQSCPDYLHDHHVNHSEKIFQALHLQCGQPPWGSNFGLPPCGAYNTWSNPESSRQYSFSNQSCIFNKICLRSPSHVQRTPVPILSYWLQHLLCFKIHFYTSVRFSKDIKMMVILTEVFFFPSPPGLGRWEGGS